MVYKKYIEKNGKRYGPYIYKSKRINGKVVSEYHGIGTKQKSRKFLFVFLGIFLLIILFCFLIFFNRGISGNVILDSKNDLYPGENLNGILKFSLEQGEFIPASTKVIINNSGNLNEYFLSDLVKQNSSQGNYSVKGTSISGVGQGYGYETIYPVVYFTLEVYSNKTNNTKDKINKSENKTQELENDSQINKKENETIRKITEINNTKEVKPKKEIPSAKENKTEKSVEPLEEKEISKEIIEEGVIKDEEIVEEELEVVEEPETKIQESSDSNEKTSLVESVVEKTLETASNFFLSLTTTGKAITEFTEVQGEVSKNKNFVYELQPGEIAKIQFKSVRTNSKDLPDDAINLKIKENEIFVSTNYSENIKKELNIDLGKLNFTMQEGDLKISFVYENETLFSLKKYVSVEKLNNETKTNETNKTSDLNKSKPSDTDLLNNSDLFNKSEINKTIINQTKVNLTDEEKEILLKEFGNVSIQTIKSELFKDRFIIGYKLGNFEIEFSYDSKEPKEILNSQIEKDKIKWLKDIAYVLSHQESSSENVNNLVKKNITLFN